MPIGAQLSDADIQCLTDWIASLEGGCETCGAAACVDFSTDANHCGACNESCPAGVACVDGACACPPGTQTCAGNCVDTSSDPSNCGSCGFPCESGQVCLNGSCGSDCGELAVCSGACVDLDNSPLHCGDCENECAPSETCTAGTCACEALDIGYADGIESILVEGCTSRGCHVTNGPRPAAADLDLSAGQGYANLVNVDSSQCGARLLVASGFPSESYLVDKVKGVDLCSGTKMPKTGPGLSQDVIAQIEGWICAGAAP